MTAPSNANTSGLEVVAWRRHDAFRKGAYFADRKDTAAMWKKQGLNPEPLVTAASAQAAIDAEKARADRLAKALEPFAVPHECDGHATVEDFNMEVQIFVRWSVIKAVRAALQQETQP